MTDATYTVSLTLEIARDTDDPLTPVEAVECFQDEADRCDLFYRVTMPDGVRFLVDMPGGAVHVDD